jgi:3-oxoadipate enol-lactonase
MRVWDAVADSYADRFRVIQYDKRGHGLSSLPPGGWRIADLAGDLAELLDRLAVSRAVVLGLSVGGMIAQSLTAARPSLVRAVVLSNTGHKIATPEAWQQRLDALQAGGIEALADGVMQRWFSARFRAERLEELAGWCAMLTRTEKDGYGGVGEAIRDADLTAEASSIACPALCIAGSEDGSTPPALLRELAGVIGPSARVVEIDGVGHLPCVERPEAVRAALDDFLKELPA